MRAPVALPMREKPVVAMQALTVIIPLFGLNYFLTLLGPDREQSHLAHLIFQLGRSVLISVQGRHSF